MANYFIQTKLKVHYQKKFWKLGIYDLSKYFNKDKTYRVLKTS